MVKSALRWEAEHSSATIVESDFADKVLGCINLDEGWCDGLVKGLANEGPRPDHSADMNRIEGAIANLRKQHLWGAIGDEVYRKAHQILTRQLRILTPPTSPKMTPNLERSAQLLQDLPALWQHPGVSPEQRRDMAREVFQEMLLRAGKLVAVTPKPNYAPLFAYSLIHQAGVGGAGLS